MGKDDHGLPRFSAAGVVASATRLPRRIAVPAGVPEPEKQREGARLIEKFIAEALISNAAGDLREERARISRQAEAAVFLAVAAVVLALSIEKKVSKKASLPLFFAVQLTKARDERSSLIEMH